MVFLPIAIDIAHQPILIVGGGKVALKKLEGLLRYTNQIRVVAPRVCIEIKSKDWVTVDERPYEPNDLDGHLLVFAATDNKDLNAKIHADALGKRCIVNVVDNPGESDFVSPAIYKQGDVSVAVTTNGQDVLTAIEWRNEIEKQFKTYQP